MPERDDAYRQGYAAQELQAGERVVRSWNAARGTGLTSAGGMLVLTDQRVLFEPMRTPKKLLTGPIAKVLGFGDAGAVVDAALDAVDSLKPVSIPLNDVATVEAGSTGASLKIVRRSGESWSFSVAASLWTVRWSTSNARTRDEVVFAIRSAAASPARGVTPAAAPVAPSTVQDLAQADPEMARLRQLAINTGNNVVIPDSDGPDSDDPPGSFVYFAPDGFLHFAFGGAYWDPPPNDATIPPNLIGTWALGGSMASTWPGEPAYLGLLPAGTLTGRLHLFGAIPPLPVQDGAWWWQAANSTLTMSLRMLPVEDIVIEYRMALDVTTITNTNITATVWQEPLNLTRLPS